MKWRTASISLLLVSAALLLGALLMKPLQGSSSAEFVPALNREDVQLGYYDLLSRQRELYDPHFALHEGKATLMLTSPDDSQFMIKVNLQQLTSGPEGMTFIYQPLYYANTGEARIIKSILGPGGQNRVQFNDLRFSDRRLIVFPSGQILNVTAG